MADVDCSLSTQFLLAPAQAEAQIYLGRAEIARILRCQPQTKPLPCLMFKCSVYRTNILCLHQLHTSSVHTVANMPHKTLTRAEVAKNNTEDSLWMIIDSRVYDVTDFVEAHPGGEAVLKQVAGTDATEAFYNLHRQEVLQKYQSLAIGTIDGEKPQVIEQKPGDLSVIPYGEPTWLTPQFKSPYYKESHRRLQKALRLFVDEHVYPVAQECEKTGKTIPQHLIDRMAEKGILHMRLGPGKHLHGVTLLDGAVKGEEFDYFHDMILGQEMTRANARGFQDGNMAGMFRICHARYPYLYRAF